MFLKVLFIVGLFFGLGLQTIFAHEESQPPFVSVNGQLTKHSEITTTSLPDFILTHDIAPETYLVNSSVSFSMDPEKLLYDKKLVEDRVFVWDLGDGAKETGVQFGHIYKAQGTYFVTIHATDQSTKDSILIFRVMLHVVPNLGYKLPDVKIGVQGMDVDTQISLDFSKPVILEAHVEGGEAAVVAYYWDLGDGQASDLPVQEHTYDTFHAQSSPLLRVRDQNGFLADTTITITNTVPSNLEGVQVQDTLNDYKKVAVIVLVLILLYLFLIYKKRRS